MGKPSQSPSCHFLAALVKKVLYGMCRLDHFISFYVISALHIKVITIVIQFIFPGINMVGSSQSLSRTLPSSSGLKSAL